MLQRPERDVMVAAVVTPDLVHEDVTARLERAADRDDPPVDPRQLPCRVARRLDVEPQQPDVAAVLHLRVVDLCALPEPWFLAGAGSCGRDQRRGDDRQDERPFHPGIISAAAPTSPVKRGTTSRTSSRAQNAMSSSSPGGPYVRAFNPASAVGNARATRSAAIAESVRSSPSSCTMRPAQ